MWHFFPRVINVLTHFIGKWSLTLKITGGGGWETTHLLWKLGPGQTAWILGTKQDSCLFGFPLRKPSLVILSLICKCKGEAVWVQLLSTGRERGWERGLNSTFTSLHTARKYRARALLLGRFRNEENMNHFSPEMWQVWEKQRDWKQQATGVWIPLHEIFIHGAKTSTFGNWG